MSKPRMMITADERRLRHREDVDCKRYRCIPCIPYVPPRKKADPKIPLVIDPSVGWRMAKDSDRTSPKDIILYCSKPDDSMRCPEPVCDECRYWTTTKPRKKAKGRTLVLRSERDKRLKESQTVNTSFVPMLNRMSPEELDRLHKAMMRLRKKFQQPKTRTIKGWVTDFQSKNSRKALYIIMWKSRAGIVDMRRATLTIEVKP